MITSSNYLGAQGPSDHCAFLFRRTTPGRKMEKTSSGQLKLEASWANRLKHEFELDYMHELKGFLKAELGQKKTIYPLGKDIFSAFNETPFDKTKVVIIGQDPYHGPRQAHGLSFSVRPGVRVPPSLKNIYKELEADLGIGPREHGYLLAWAKQGVLMLNSVLTVEGGKAGSHRGRGWERFTDKVVETLNQKKKHLVFVLWEGRPRKRAFI